MLVDPLYRVFFLVLLFQGFGSGGAVTFVALWASQALGASAIEVGLLRTISGLVGVGFGLVLGTVTDRTRRRAPWIVAGMGISALGWLGVALARDYAGGMVAYALASVGGFTLLFALLGDWLRYRRAEDATVVNSTIRLSFALGWVAGPAVAGLVVAASGYTPLFVGTAALQGLAVLMAVRWLRDPPAPAPVAEAAPGQPARDETAVVALWLYLAAMFLSSAASPGRFVLLPLYITEELRAPVTLVGLLFTVSVVYELPLFLLVGHVAQRYGVGRLLTAGFASYAVYFAGLAVASAYWQLLGLEVLFAFLVATTNGLGMLHVQNLAPARAGTAIALYGSASQLGAIASAPALGYIATAAGWGGAFATSSGLAVLSVGAFLLSQRALRRWGRADREGAA